jgi:hypothetical protein
MSPILASPLFWRQFRLLLIHLRKLIKFILIILILIISLIFQFTLIHSLVHADYTLCPIIEIIRCGIIITGEFSWLVVLLVLLVFTIQVVVFYTLCQIIICPIINVCSVLWIYLESFYILLTFLPAKEMGEVRCVISCVLDVRHKILLLSFSFCLECLYLIVFNEHY